MATIGNLSVSVTADTTGLATGLKTSESLISGFSAKAAALTDKLIAVGPAAIAAGAAIGVVMVKNVIDAADKLTDLSERTGIAIEDLSRLGYVAQMSGISADEMTGAINRLSQGMANGNSAFEAMGVSVRNADGSLRSQIEVLGEVADKFATYRDGTAKTALAMDLFGKSGASLIPVLNGGSAGIAKLSQESDRLGNTISTELAQSSAELNDNLDRLRVLSGNAAQSVAGSLTPALVSLTDAMIANIEKASEYGNVFSGMFDALSSKAMTATFPMLRFLSILQETNKLSGTDPYANETAKFQRQGVTAPVAEQTNAPDVKAAEAAKKDAEERAKQRADELAQIRQNELDKAQAFIDALTMKRDARIEANLTDAEIEQERYTLEQEKLLEALELGLITKGEYQALEQEQLMAHREAMADIESQYLTDQLARERAAADERVRIQDAAEQMIRNARAATFSDAANLLTMLGGKSKAAAVAAIALNKGLAIAQIIQNTAVAQMRAMAELGPIAGPPAAAKIGVMGKIQAGIAAATGLAQIAGLGGGSSSAVTAGGVTASGSVGDSATAQNQQMIAAPRQNQTITIQMQGEIFGREQVRTLITEINDAVADGAVLRLA